MDKKSTIIIAVIIILGIIGFVVISLQRSSLDTLPQVETASTTSLESIPFHGSNDLLLSPKTVVSAKHAYQNGKHIIAGEVPLPTPCHMLEATGVASADKKQVFITLVSSIKTDQTCAQVITPARFKVSIAANKDAKISATLNGQEIILNLIEAGQNENLDNFELYIKG